MSQGTPPLIGITTSASQNKDGSTVCNVGQAYVNVIEKAGGMPLLIPVEIGLKKLNALAPRLDGVLFTGGGDIDLRFFDGQTHPAMDGVNLERDLLEFGLLKLALKANLPILAICRGIQVLNVWLGGALYTHIQDQLPGALKHDWYPDFPRDRIAHTVNVTPGSKLFHILGEKEMPVNSLHHQGILKIGQGLEPVAASPDGLVEAVEVIGQKFALGVQWHPECLTEALPMQNLFQAFIEASRK